MIDYGHDAELRSLTLQAIDSQVWADDPYDPAIIRLENPDIDEYDLKYYQHTTRHVPHVYSGRPEDNFMFINPKAVAFALLQQPAAIVFYNSACDMIRTSRAHD